MLLIHYVILCKLEIGQMQHCNIRLKPKIWLAL